jgi:hypothetical protein
MERVMKRLLAIVFFVASGFATELVHPVQCLLITSAASQQKRRRR